MSGDGWWVPEPGDHSDAGRARPSSGPWRPGQPAHRRGNRASSWGPQGEWPVDDDAYRDAPPAGAPRDQRSDYPEFTSRPPAPESPGHRQEPRARRSRAAGRAPAGSGHPGPGGSPQGRINRDLDLDEVDPGGRARKRAAREVARSSTRRGKKPLRFAALSMAGVVFAVAGLGAYLYVHFNGNIKTAALLPDGVTQGAEVPDRFGRTPMNVLLLGNGGRVNAADCTLGGACSDISSAADVMMVVHLAADRSNMTVMSIPRDSIVDLPACAPDRVDLVNAALVNGPSCAVQAVHDLTGLTIDHFIEIDMSGVVTLSNALGGVPACVTNNVYDSYSHLRLPKGVSVIEGTQALAWLRTRHAFINEVYREQAQHMFMAALVRKLKANASLTHITTLYGVADAATKALTVDPGLSSVTDLLSLGQDIGKVPSRRITFLSVPTAPYAGANPAWKQQLQFDQPAAGDMFTALKSDQPYTPGADTPASTAAGGDQAPGIAGPSVAPTAHAVDIALVRARIENGSGIAGRAAAVRGALVSQGFSSSELTAGNAAQPSSTTVLYYPANRAQSAQAVAQALRIPASAMHESADYSEVTVVIGSDWPGGATFRASSSTTSTTTSTAPTTVASAPPSSSLETNGADAKSCMYVPHPEW